MNSSSILRHLESARGPRSVKEIAKGCKVEHGEVESILESLKQEGKVVHIMTDVWCFSPSSNKGISSNSTSIKKPYTPPPVPRNDRTSYTSIPYHAPKPHQPQSFNAPRSYTSQKCFNTQPQTSCSPRPHLLHENIKVSSIPPPPPPSSKYHVPAPISNKQPFIHPSRTPWQTSNVSVGGTVQDDPSSASSGNCPDVLTSTEKNVLVTLGSQNNPWTFDQIRRAHDLNMSASVVDSLVKKGFLIKIESKPVMFTIKPGAKIPSAPSRFGGLPKRPLECDYNSSSEKVNHQATAGTANKKARLDVINSLKTDAINKNPISAVTELSQALGVTALFQVIRTSGPKHKKRFHMRLTLGDKVFDSVSTNKKEAKVYAAEIALRSLHSETSTGVNSGSNFIDVTQVKSRNPDYNANKAPNILPVTYHQLKGVNFFDKIGKFSYDLYNKMASTVNAAFPGRKVISVFVLEDCRVNPKTWTPLSMGTGNRTITGDNINFEGKTVNDSHAEIIARRGFRRFLWKQLKIVEKGEVNSYDFDNILEKQPSGKYSLHDDLKIHVFISTAPCGDSAIFPISDVTAVSTTQAMDETHKPLMENERQGLMRSKMENGQGTIPISCDEPELTIDGIMMGNQRVKTMSCSDKVSRWNILGLQGCLLSQYLNPIYMSSLTLGCLYHHGHLSRAVCCRYRNINLTLPYRLNHPMLGCVPGQEAERELGKTTEMSLNWSLGDSCVEVTDGCRGRCGKGVVSRISRKVILEEYNSFTGECLTDYNKAKKDCFEYNNTKKVFLENIAANKYGQWLAKPVY